MIWPRDPADVPFEENYQSVLDHAYFVGYRFFSGDNHLAEDVAQETLTRAYERDKVARLTTGGVITEFPLPNTNSQPDGITNGPDGNLWFTENTAARIGRITVQGGVAEYPTPGTGSQPQTITTGSVGTLWFTEPATNRVGFIRPQTGP